MYDIYECKNGIRETFIARAKTGELELLAGGDDFCRRKLRVPAEAGQK